MQDKQVVDDEDIMAEGPLTFGKEKLTTVTGLPGLAGTPVMGLPGQEGKGDLPSRMGVSPKATQPPVAHDGDRYSKACEMCRAAMGVQGPHAHGNPVASGQTPVGIL